MKKTYIIGDIHGEFTKLKELITKIGTNHNIYCVGDLIDKGLKSKEVVEFLILNNIPSVLGNHEDKLIDIQDKLIDSLKEENLDYINKLSLGFLYTLASYNLIKLQQNKFISFTCSSKKIKKLREHIKWFETLPIYIVLEIKDRLYLISHSGMLNIINDIDEDVFKYKSYVLKNRTEQISNKFNSRYFNIFGHTPNGEPYRGKNYINIDTGACYSKSSSLTAYCIEEDNCITNN